VRPNVHLEGAQTDVDFVAVFTAEGFFGLLLDAVELLVLGQPAVGRVGFMAIGALVARCGDVRRPAALLGFGDADDRRIGRQGSAATGGGGREVFDVAAVRHFTGSSEVAAQVGTG